MTEKDDITSLHRPAAPSRKEMLERTLTRVAGTPVSITVRGLRRFTFSTDEHNPEAAERLASFARQSYYAEVSIHNDPEAGSFVYLDVAEGIPATDERRL